MKSRELQVLSLLRQRTRLDDDSFSSYNRLQSGYLGERKFASLLKENLTAQPIILYHLLLEFERCLFEIDCLMIFAGQIYLIEVKYFQNDYVYDDGNWVNVRTKKKAKNPIHQLSRCEDLLQNFLSSHGIYLDINAKVVFVHETFTLYQAPLKLPYILPTQVKRFIDTLNDLRCSLTEQEMKTAKLLVENHLADSPHERLPTYDFSKLRKGIFCLACEKPLKPYRRKALICGTCNAIECLDSAVIRGVVDFSVLFREERITTTVIYQWIGQTVTVKTIRSILSEYMIKKGKHRYTYFIFKDHVQ
jgi:hypothetical protein